MGTDIRPEISQNKPYWISKHRYYELRHFCLQYKIWKEFYSKLDGYSEHHYMLCNQKPNSEKSPVEKTVISREFYLERMQMVEQAAKETDPVIGDYIFKAVTKGLSYEHLKARYSIPCCKNTYYDLYRKFFWILNDLRK